MITVTRPTESSQHRSLHGLTRTLIANMVEGVTNGFEKRLEIVGVGYRAALKGKALELNVGYSHPVVVEPPESVAVRDAAGHGRAGEGHRQAGRRRGRGRSCARLRPPEPYKGKGIRYAGEYVQRKVGKRA